MSAIVDSIPELTDLITLLITIVIIIPLVVIGATSSRKPIRPMLCSMPFLIGPGYETGQGWVTKYSSIDGVGFLM